MSRSSTTARSGRAPTSHHPSRVARRTKVAAAAAATALSLGALGAWANSAGAAAAPVPTFPDNIVVFPDRDFVSVEGYEERAGQEATLEVFRPGVGIVGSAKAIVDAGGVAFEINHPGGYCWGAGTGLNVTPDLVPGDEVSIIFDGQAVGTTTVADVHASDAVLLNPTTMVVTGRIAGIPADQMEQRIIEPALVDTAIGKRDIRAVLGDFQPGPNGGYQSKLEVVGETFTATYVFDDPAVAAIAADASLGERAMAWQLVDAAANRQGLTIAEFGEPGGPGFGGCPNGPLQSGPPAPTDIAAARVPGSTTLTVHWNPAVALPGTQPILGYRVTAIDTAISGGERIEIGRRIGNPLATGTTITGLDPSRDYDLEVVSISSVGLTQPAATPAVVSDTVAPVITASPAGGSYPVAQSVKLTANEPGVDIWYTTDGSDPIDNAGGTTATALHYTGAITVAANTTLTYAGYDPSSNPSAITTQAYTITNDPTAAKTNILTAVPGLQSVALTWQAADPVAPAVSIVRYVVNVYDSSGANTPIIPPVTFEGPGTSGTITGLTGNQPYWFTVAAVNDINPTAGPESNRVGPIVPRGPVVADAGPDQANVARNTPVTLTGALSTTGAGITYQWVQLANANGLQLIDPLSPNKVTITTPTSVNAGFLMPFYKAGMSAGPLYFQLTVTNTGTGESRADRVTIAPRNDTVTVATAKWKQNDFRVTGTGAIDGATITVRWTNANGQPGSATTTVVAGAWDLRVRNAAAPAAPGPAQVFVDSNQGGTVGPTTVAR
jgi:hypothetical protein